jgi:hypothetical protein
MELYGVQETFAIAALIVGDTFFYTRHFGKGGGGDLWTAKTGQKSIIFQLWQIFLKLVFVVYLPIKYSLHKWSENKYMEH